jgi:hypothetical protein
MHGKEDVYCSYRALVEKPEGKSHLEGRGVGERIILKWISKTKYGRVWTVLCLLRNATFAGASGHLYNVGE